MAKQEIRGRTLRVSINVNNFEGLHMLITRLHLFTAITDLWVEHVRGNIEIQMLAIVYREK